MSRDNARTHLADAAICLTEASDSEKWNQSDRMEIYLDGLLKTLMAIAEIQLDQLELSRRVRTK